MAPRIIPMWSGNRTRASSTIRRRRHRFLSLETLDKRILLSSSPIGLTIGPIDLAPTQRTQGGALKPGATSTLESATSTSPNWSGYVAESNLSAPQAGSVTAVSGSWVVPKVSGPQGTSSHSCVWVGIDGWGEGTVEQVGTEQDLSSNGVSTDYAWWEMYSTYGNSNVPGEGEQAIISGMKVSPGDQITASVQYISSGTHAGQFLLQINDTSRTNDSSGPIYQTSAQTQNPQPLRNSAEWIVEAPHGTNLPPNVYDELANFGAVTFTNATATIDGVTGPINSAEWQSTSVNMGYSYAPPVPPITEASTSAVSNPTPSTSSFSVSYALGTSFDVAGTLYTLQNGTVYSCPAGQSNWSPIDTDVTSFASGPAGTTFAGWLVDLGANGALKGYNDGVWHTWDTGVTSFAFGPSGSSYAGDLVDLRGNGTLSSNNSSGWVQQDIDVTSFVFGPAGTNFAGELVALHTNGDLADQSGVLDTGVTSFAFGLAGTTYVATLFDLRGDGTLSATTNGTAWATSDTGVESFAFGPSGSSYAGDLVDLRGNGTLSSNNSSGWVQQDIDVTSFVFGPAGTNFAGELVALHTNGDLADQSAVVLDTGVTSFAFGLGGTELRLDPV